MPDDTPDQAAARAELLAAHDNAFAVAAHADGRTRILSLPPRPLTRPEVANLVAWLTICAGLADADVMPILWAKGYLVQPPSALPVRLSGDAAAPENNDDRQHRGHKPDPGGDPF